MREIKFRAWDKDTRQMIKDFSVRSDGYLQVLEGDGRSGVFMRQDFLLMQYTGLKDKYGTEVYEGDILRVPAGTTYEETTYNSFEVFWHDNDATPTDVGLVLGRLTPHGNSAGGHSGYKLIPRDVRRMIVIGNIYENPELLGANQ